MITVNQFLAPQLDFVGAGIFALERSAMLGCQTARLLYRDMLPINPNLGGLQPQGSGSAGPDAQSAACAAFAPGQGCAVALSLRARGRAPPGAEGSRSAWSSAGVNRRAAKSKMGR